MTQFFLYSFIIIHATACFNKMLFISIQHGQWLDNLLSWQERVRKWDEQGKTALAKWGGACEICFSAFWCGVLTIPYLALMNIIGQWSIHNLIGGILWVPMYWSISTNTTLWFITKMRKRSNDT